MADALDTLGAPVQITDATTTAELSSVIERHRAALLQVRGDVARVAERAELMIPEVSKLLDKQRETTRTEWDPQGNAGQLDARYLRDDGAVQWGSRTETVVGPGGALEQVRVHGLLDAPYTVTPEHERARRAFSRYAMAAHIESKIGASGTAAKERQFRLLTQELRAIPGRTGAAIRRALSDPGEYQRVINGTAGTGGQLIAVPTVASIVRPTDMARGIAALIAVESASAPSFKRPIIAGRGLSRKRGSTTADPARFPVQVFTTSDETLNVVDRVAMAGIDPLWLQDASIGDPMGLVMDFLAMADADSLELAILHGDTAGTHQDTLSTWTMDGMFTAGQLDGSDSPAKFWLGWRATAADDINTASASGSLDLADFFAAVESLGARGGSAAHITGLNLMYTKIMLLTEVKTVDVFGPRASVIAGQVAEVGGRPIVLSQMMGKEFDTGSGLYTGSNKASALLTVATDRWRQYVLDAGPTGDFEEARPERGIVYVGMTRRSVIAKNTPSGEKTCHLTYNP